MGKLYTADNFVTIGGTTDQYVTGAGTLVTFPPIPSGVVDGTGTANYVSKWLDSNTIADSVIFDNGTNIGIGTTVLTERVNISGKLNITDTLNNVFIGTSCGTLTTTGNLNSALGRSSLGNNTTGLGNISIGYFSLFLNQIGNFNTAIGYRVLRNSLADKNTALGAETMFSNTTGTFNTALGQEALRANLAGIQNTSVGCFALLNAEANYVTALGRDAGRFSSAANLTTSTESVFLGYNTKSLNTTSTNEIVIGANAVGVGDNSVVLGNSSIVTTVLNGNVGIGTTNPNAKLDVTGGDAIINTVTVGRGGGSVSSNTVLGRNALDANSTGANNICVGSGAAAGLSNNASGRVVIGTDLFLTPNLDDIGNDELVISQYNQNAASFQLPHIYVPKPLSIPNGATTDVIAFDLGHYVGAFVEYIIYLDDGSDYAMGTVYMAWKPSGSGNFRDVRQIEWSNMSNFTFSLGGTQGTTLTLDNTSSNNAWIRITVRAMMTN